MWTRTRAKSVLPLKGSALSRSRWSRSPASFSPRRSSPAAKARSGWTRTPPTRRALYRPAAQTRRFRRRARPRRGTAATAAYRAIPPAFLAEFGLSPALLPPGDLAVFEDSLHFLPAPALAHLPAAVRWQGMALGKASAQGLIPSARLRALLDPEPQRIPRLDVDDVPVLERLLQGGSLDTGLPGKEASLFWRGLPLGRLRLKAGRAVWSDR